MRVLLHSDHRYPGDDGRGVGIATRYEPSGAPHHIHDLIARGLAEMGHEVFYFLPKGTAAPLPPGVRLVDSPVDNADIFHNLDRPGKPWILTQHRVREAAVAPADNWVFVSRSLASLYGSTRFVRNGLDPYDYIYSEAKLDYFLFLASMQGNAHANKYIAKGLPVALSLARELGFRLIVAGTSRDETVLGAVASACRDAGAAFLGDVRGRAKAELLAGARALLFPTQIHEGLPLVLIEALFSGTPVIASHHGPCPEMVSPEVGFVCRTFDDYAFAIQNASSIRSSACREKALHDHHYRTMVDRYIREYETEAGKRGGEPKAARGGE